MCHYTIVDVCNIEIGQNPCLYYKCESNYVCLSFFHGQTAKHDAIADKHAEPRAKASNMS